MIEARKGMNKWQYTYYVLLLLIMLFLGKIYTGEPPMVLRLAFLAALFVVPIKSGLTLLPAILTCFFIVSDKGIGYNILPSDYLLYCIPLLLFALISIKNRTGTFVVPKIVVIICTYSLIINYVSSGVIQNLSYSCLVLICYVIISDTELNVNYKTAAIFLALTSIALSISFIYSGSEYTTAYMTSGFERTGWTDPNYFSTTIGFSVLVSIAMLLSQKNNILETILFVANIIVSIIVMVLVASRGGILSLAAGISVLLFFSKIKLKYKILSVILLTAFVIYLFNNDYFALLQYRIEREEGEGSGRTIIWENKLSKFFDSSPITWIFGMGYWNGTYLGGNTTNYSCIHNDYIAYLVCYGVIGLVLYILMLIYPIRNSNKKHYLFPVVVSSVVYLAITGFTLEPLSSGMLGYFCFYFYILLLMQFSRAKGLEHK